MMSEGCRIKLDTRSRKRTDLDRAGGIGEEYGRTRRGQGSREDKGRGGRREGGMRSLADMIGDIRREMEEKVEAVVGKAEIKMQGALREGMMQMAETVNEKMSLLMSKVMALEDRVDGITEQAGQERNEWKDMEQVKEESLARMAAKIEKIESGLKAVKDRVKGAIATAKQEVSGRREEEQRSEERLAMLEEKVNITQSEVGRATYVRMSGFEGTIQALQAKVDRLSFGKAEEVVEDQVKAMEDKVKDAMRAVKVLNIDIGKDTEDKADIVRKALREVRRQAREEEEGNLDRILTRTRVVVLGRKTQGMQERGRSGYTVPILFQCQDRKDTQKLERILRTAGYFPTFHWPTEVMEFIRRIRQKDMEVARQERHYRFRPDVRAGRVRIRLEVKPKAGGSFTMKGIWKCPPLDQELWGGVGGLYTPQVVGRG